jgi:hypothetical protein
MSSLHNARNRPLSMLGPRLLVAACLAAALGAAAWTPAWPQVPSQVAAAAKCMIHLEVRVLQASNPPASKPASPGTQSPAPAGAAPGGVADSQMGERLNQIVPRLRKLFRYSDFTPLDHHSVDVECGSTKELPVAGKRRLGVMPQELQGKSVRMQVRLLNGKKQVMNVKVVAGPGAPSVVSAPLYAPGDLIIVIWADPIIAPAANRSGNLYNLDNVLAC